MKRYNIIECPCFPVVEGEVEKFVSLRDALTHADRYALSVAEPLAVLPLIRILVACVAASDKSILTERGMGGAWDRGGFDLDALERYFEEQYDAFELFDSKRPFMQVAGLEPVSGPPKSAALLLPGEVIGNSVPLFGSFTEGDVVALPVSRALLGLLTLQAYDTAAIKPGAKGDPAVKSGKTTGNHTGYLGQLGGVAPWGRNLFETILLNVPQRPSPEHDRPTWEREQSPAWEIRQPTGILELLSWQSRRMRLVQNEAGDAVVGCVMAAGDRVNVIPEYEPHTRWRRVKNPGGGPATRPRRWQPAQSSWRGVDSLIAFDSKHEDLTSGLLEQVSHSRVVEDTYPLGVFCVGVAYGNQSAVIEDVVVDSLPLPVRALNMSESPDVAETVSSIAKQAEEVRQALNNLENGLREAAGGDRIPWDAGNHAGNQGMALLDTPARRVLSALQEDQVDAHLVRVEWEREVERVAWSIADPLLNSVPSSTFRGASNGGKNAAMYERFFGAALRKSLVELTEERSRKGEEE